MSSKAGPSGHKFAFAMTTAGIVAMSTIIASAPGRAQTAPTESTTTSIKRDSEQARKLNEPSYDTREERLRAKPLDWKKTSGTPTPRKLTEAERKALEEAKPETSEGGKPNPNAQEEARKLHPKDWK